MDLLLTPSIHRSSINFSNHKSIAFLIPSRHNKQIRAAAGCKPTLERGQRPRWPPRTLKRPKYVLLWSDLKATTVLALTSFYQLKDCLNLLSENRFKVVRSVSAKLLSTSHNSLLLNSLSQTSSSILEVLGLPSYLSNTQIGKNINIWLAGKWLLNLSSRTVANTEFESKSLRHSVL